MNDWFRSWHGAPTDAKWLAIARRAKAAPGFVVATAWTLMDRASQHANRGSIAGYDAEAMAVYLGCEDAQVEAIITAMREKGVLSGDRFATWEARQPKREREDNSTPRVQNHRLKKTETPCNATQHPETPRLDEIRLESKKELRPKRVRTYSELFERFWNPYPRDKLMSKAEAFVEWEKLSSGEQEMAIRAAPEFAKYCSSKPDYRPVHANRFLKQRRFESFGGDSSVIEMPVAAQRIFVRRGSSQWQAWMGHTDNNSGRGFPIIQVRGEEGWWFPTDYPGYQTATPDQRNAG